MSLILEALKKSEQQRQQKHGGQQKVRKRTLAIGSSRPTGRPYYWLLVVAVALVCLGAGWWYSQARNPGPPADRMARIPEQPADAANQPAATGPASASAAAVSDSGRGSQRAVAQAAPQPTPRASTSPATRLTTAKAAPRTGFSAEPAPVPREFVEPPAVVVREASPTPARAFQQEQPKPHLSDQPKAGALPTTAAPAASSSSSARPGGAGIPLYQDLSEELHARIPPLTMSMHFYAKDPERRLVRINGRLLREGTWLSDDLQLVEITPTGATLDFLGKTFEIRGSRR